VGRGKNQGRQGRKEMPRQPCKPSDHLSLEGRGGRGCRTGIDTIERIKIKQKRDGNKGGWKGGLGAGSLRGEFNTESCKH